MKITGNVVSIEGDPLMGVNIYAIKDEQPFGVGGTSNYDGKFNIDLESLPSNQDIRISYVGYIPQTFKASDLQNRKIILTDMFEMLDEVTVVAKKNQPETLTKKLGNLPLIASILAILMGAGTIIYVIKTNKKNGKS